jgi:nucleoside-diphosphate-sugar epimerase
LSKILITGGAGYLGSVFTRNLLKNHEVIVYDNLMYNQTSLVDLSNNSNFTFHYGDVREWSKLKYLVEQVDIVIPLAALVGFPLCEKDKDLATSINTTQIQNIVDVLSDDQMILY